MDIACSSSNIMPFMKTKTKLPVRETETDSPYGGTAQQHVRELLLQNFCHFDKQKSFLF